MARETWTVRNTTGRQIGIGDLMFAPVVEPGKTVDLLRYHSYNQIEQSQDLAALLRSGWLTLTKTKTPLVPAIDRMEEEEVDAKDDTVTSNLQGEIGELTLPDLADVTAPYSAADIGKSVVVDGAGTGLVYGHATSV